MYYYQNLSKLNTLIYFSYIKKQIQQHFMAMRMFETRVWCDDSDSDDCR